MKRILLVSFILSLLLIGCSSDPAIDAAFSKYSSKNGIVSITVPGFAVRTATLFADLNPEEKDLLREVDLVKILAVDDEAKYKQVNFNKEFSKMVSSDYQPLMSVKDGSNDINILAKMKSEEEISDLLIIVGGNDNAMIYIKGNFNLTEIAEKSNLLKGKSWKSMISMYCST